MSEKQILTAAEEVAISRIPADFEITKARILELLRMVDRPGIEDLIHYLQFESDYFIAPGSSRHHMNCPAGLSIHSLYVCELFLEKCRRFGLFEKGLLTEAEAIISSLLHDMCKTQYYKAVIKTPRTKKGEYSEPKLSFKVEDLLPFGHGERSLYIIMEKFPGFLTLNEKLLIRWHMDVFSQGGMSSPVKGQLDKAKALCPAITALFTADYEATHLLENLAEELNEESEEAEE